MLRRDLAVFEVPHLASETIAAFVSPEASGPPRPGSGAAISDELIEELSAADDVVVASALYNFNAPSTLKAYIDHVIRAGRTFAAGEHGFTGLLRGRSACLITARGGRDGEDHQAAFLQTAFRFMGFDRVEWISLEGTAMGGEQLERGLAEALMAIDAWFAPPEPTRRDPVEWRGTFSASDRAEIHALRDGQVRAILAGDAIAYSRLCTEDVVLMLQGQEAAFGKAAFIDVESKLFGSVRFTTMMQVPLRVERQGAMAVEVGVSEVATSSGGRQADCYRARRKYTHVLRKTSDGWRFAVLMSNNSL